jgi:cation diffusion facilitator family transporter
MSERRFSIYIALAANLAIAVTKFVAAAVGGSTAMLAEALHSVVDTGDGLLLLLGMRLSRRPPSRRHPYGHGAEIYFWSMVVAMSIFGMGGGVSIYEGINHLIHPAPLRSALIAYLVLAFSFVFEGASWLVARRSFRRIQGSRPTWEAIERSKDPTTFMVLLEDSAALIGVVIAALGVALSHRFDAPALDAIASILIGALLVAMAVVVGRETWSLLLGEAADHELVESVRRTARSEPGVTGVYLPRTMQLGPELVHVDLDMFIDDARTAHELVELCRHIEVRLHRRHPEIHRVSFRFPDGSPAQADRLAAEPPEPPEPPDLRDAASGPVPEPPVDPPAGREPGAPPGRSG